MEDGQKRVFDLRQLSKKSEIRIHGGSYEDLVNVIKTLGKILELKQDTNKFYETITKRGLSDTDERIVATAYWISMFSDKQPILITRDGDFTRLFWITGRLLGAHEFEGNQHFRKSLEQNPVKVYHKNRDGKYEIRVNTREMEYRDKFVLHKIPSDKENGARELIQKMWRNFRE